MKKLSQIFMVVCYLIAGVLLGLGMVAMLPGDLYWYDDLIAMAFMVVVAYIAIMIQVIIHECGHMIFGLISGYHFVSFRIFNMMLIKQNDHWKLKQYSLAGTGGQCLMAPADLIDGKMPVMLYNLGGVIMNIIVSMIFMILCFNVDDPFIFLLLYMLIIIGIVTAITNGIPMQVNNINNDGYHVLELKRNPQAVYAFWFQLKIASLQAEGYRFKDMPIDFKVCEEDALDNCLIAMQQALYCNYLMDKHEFDIEITDEELSSLKTVEDIVKLIESKK
ncbi:MAG: M50 family metallopeptidase [Erysipelotrichaceae bacterium]|nr:M50 family metallopeptidase [Erysipelotrichaceae bacterium]